MGRPENSSKEPDADQFIVVRGLCKSFNTSGARIEVLKDVNFDLDAGGTVAVVGASGIGKSTLLHILGALDRPDSGSFWFKGEDVFLFDNLKLARFRNESVGFVFQFHHLLPEFSTLENAMMPALIKGLSKKKAQDAAETVLVKVGLQDRLSYRVGKLSGGEQQRVALARALVLKPVILLADEPTGNLDRQTGKEIMELLQSLNSDQKLTIVMVTHDHAIAGLADRTVRLVEGLVERVS